MTRDEEAPLAISCYCLLSRSMRVYPAYLRTF